MFGRGWKSAEATVVTFRLLAKSFDGDVGGSFTRNEYILDVRPDDYSPPFRGTAKDPLNAITWRQPSIGQVVRVQFRPKDNEVRFDRDDADLHQDTPRQANKKDVAEAHSAEAMQQWHADLQAPPATAPNHVPPHMAAVVDLSHRVAETAAMTTDMTETITAIKHARETGNLAEVDRLKAEFKSRMTARAALSGRAADEIGANASLLAGAASRLQAGASDPLVRLQKLADLHDRGVLTDAEFATEKAKILRET